MIGIEGHVLPAVLTILCLVTINYFCSINTTPELMVFLSLTYTVVNRCEDRRCFPISRVSEVTLILFSKHAWMLDL